MNPRGLTVVAICVVVLWLAARQSSFTDKNEKVSAIYDWFTNNPGAPYTQYSKDLKNQSNVVEYFDVAKLAQGNDLTKSTVARIVS